MQQGRGGMGSRKHGKSGCRNKKTFNPRHRLWMRRFAEEEFVKRRRKVRLYGSIREALEQEGKI